MFVWTTTVVGVVFILSVPQETVRAEFPICTAPGWQDHPMITGNTVVYVDSRNGNADIYAFDLAAKTEFPICTNPADQGNWGFRVDGDLIVWSDNRNGNMDIYGYDLSTHTEFPVCTDPGYQGEVAISGNVVAWKDNRYDLGDIFGFNIDTDSEFPICTAGGQQEYPAIAGKFVIWQDKRNGNNDIYGFDLEAQTEFLISTNAESDASHVIEGNYVVWAGRGIDCFDLETQTGFHIGVGLEPAISGNIVVWVDQGTKGIQGYDLAAESAFLIPNTSMREWHIERPAIHGNNIVWSDNRNNNWDIFGYNLISGTEFSICTNHAFNERSFAINADHVVFASKRNVSSDIYGFSFSENEEVAFATEIVVGQAMQGSTNDDDGVDVTEHGYNDVVDTWYYFIPTTTDRYTISICGSDFDTTLAVLDENLVEVEFNDNFCGDQSKLVLRGKADKKYYIRVAGYDGDRGNYYLSIIKDSPEPLKSDINFDGKVNIADFSILADEWLEGNQR